jgi:glycosyltransferase involved in cell wall biosynthesis
MPWENYDFEVFNRYVKDKIEVHKTNAPRFKSLGASGFNSSLTDKLILRFETLLFEDRLDWAVGSRHKAIDLVKGRKADLIYTTGPPQTVHFLGYYIKKKTGLPWVMDFRDPMAKLAPTWISNNVKQFFQKLRNKSLLFLYERIFINEANYAVAATRPMEQDFISLHPKATAKLTTITNGFDEDDFIGVTPQCRNPAKMNILYTGRFWAHNPLDFLQGLKIALQCRPSLREELKITFIGEISSRLKSLFNSNDFYGTIKSTGPMNHRDSIAHQLGSDLNLLIIDSTDRGAKSIFTGKIFEYLRAQKPILGIVPKGIARNLIEQNNLGYTVDPKNHEQIANTICLVYDKWKNGTLRSFQPSKKLLEQFDRKHLTEKLAELFDKCL